VIPEQPKKMSHLPLLNFSKLSQHRVDVLKSLIYLIPHLLQPNICPRTSHWKTSLCNTKSHPVNIPLDNGPIFNKETGKQIKGGEESDIPWHQWEQSCQTQKWATQSWAASFYRSILEIIQAHTAAHIPNSQEPGIEIHKRKQVWG
jgi:hypothetical protein